MSDEFSLEGHVPADHLVRSIDRFVELGELRKQLAPFYSETGRPSVDPELMIRKLMIRMLIIGYCLGIRSERRLSEEVHLNPAYRWFCRLGFEGRVPDHSTFSKNRHRRFPLTHDTIVHLNMRGSLAGKLMEDVRPYFKNQIHYRRRSCTEVLEETFWSFYIVRFTLSGTGLFVNSSLLCVSFALLAGYFVADLASGLVHWGMDTWFSERSLVRAVAIAREHSTHPQNILRYGFLEQSTFF